MLYYCDIVVKGPKATGAHYRCAFGRKSFVRGLAPPSVRTANPTHTLRVFGHGSPFWRYARPLTDFQTNAYSVMCTGGFLRYGNKKCRSKPINSFYTGGGLYLSTAFFMWHIQYSRKGSSMYNKHSLGNWGPFVSIADRVEALFEHAKRVSLPEPCLTGGGTKDPKLPWMLSLIHIWRCRRRG